MNGEVSHINTPIIKVKASVLDKNIGYAPVPVDMSTTAQEVVCLLVNKYGTKGSSEDEYYLAEVSVKIDQSLIMFVFCLVYLFMFLLCICCCYI